MLRNHGKWMVLFFIGTITIACGSNTVYPSLEEDVQLNESPEMVFLTYQWEKQDSGLVSVALTDKILAKGKLKKEEDTHTYGAGDYQLLQLNAKGQVLASKKIENPLSQLIEYVNENGEFQKKKVDFDQKEVSIRWQLHSKAKFMVMQEIGNEKVNFVKTKI